MGDFLINIKHWFFCSWAKIPIWKNRTNETITKTQEHLTILSLECDQQTISASLSDGRTVSVPTAWFKRLRQATQQQLNNYKLSPAGCAIHWEELDEDISIKSFLNGLSKRGNCKKESSKEKTVAFSSMTVFAHPSALLLSNSA